MKLFYRLDPDLLVGYEIQKSSWGYLLQRAAQVGIDLCSQISRIPGNYISIYILTMSSFYRSVINVKMTIKDTWLGPFSDTVCIRPIIFNLWMAKRCTCQSARFGLTFFLDHWSMLYFCVLVYFKLTLPNGPSDIFSSHDVFRVSSSLLTLIKIFSSLTKLDNNYHLTVYCIL